MYNKVILLGRITQDLQLKTTPQGTSVLTFSIAVDRRFQTKGEEKKADFFNCVAWRQEAEFISRYWTKGRPILVEGELQNRSYVDKNGVTRYVTEVIVGVINTRIAETIKHTHTTKLASLRFLTNNAITEPTSGINNATINK